MPRMIPVSEVPELNHLWDRERNEASPGEIGKTCQIKVHWRCGEGVPVGE